MHDNNQKIASVILASLKGQAPEEICAQYGISNEQYQLWRHKYLEGIDLNSGQYKDNRLLQRLLEANLRLKMLLGDIEDLSEAYQ